MAKELRKKQRRKRRLDEPFVLTVCKVGSALALLSAIIYMIISYQSVVRYTLLEDMVHQPFRTTDLRSSESLNLPPYNDGNGDWLGDHGSTAARTLDGKFAQEAARLRKEFAARYSRTEDEARDLLMRSMSGSPAALAFKLQKRKKELSIWIAGSSAAAGYGNRHHQAYGYVLDELLRPVTDTMDLSLRIHNMAMKELTEFPFAWCFPDHYWTAGVPDIIVWDFGEELSSPHVSRMEAFLRFVAALRSDFRATMFFRGVRTAEQWSLIQRYEGVIDSLVLPDEFIIPEVEDLPLGFENFHRFGAPGPDTLHGHNLSVEQHVFTAWLLAMHLVAALELSLVDTGGSDISAAELPTSLYVKQRETGWEKILSQPRQMLAAGRSLHCRTSFEHTEMTIEAVSMLYRNPSPLFSYVRSDLQDLIVGGTSMSDAETSIEYLLLPKTAEHYNRGWILDLDSESKRGKLLMKTSSNFLGFRDWKMAYYGVPQSGPLQFFVPSEAHDQDKIKDRKAVDVFSLLMICESDAIVASQNDSCMLHRDATFAVEGQSATSILVDTDVVATTSGKRTCVQVILPPQAQLSSITRDNEFRYGIHVDVTIKNPKITWKNGPCSVAHIIWMSASTT